MAKVSTLRSNRAIAVQTLDRALTRKQGGIGKARREAVLATAELIRAELNNRIAAPLLRARAQRQQTGDLFAQIGA